MLLIAKYPVILSCLDSTKAFKKNIKKSQLSFSFSFSSCSLNEIYVLMLLPYDFKEDPTGLPAKTAVKARLTLNFVYLSLNIIFWGSTTIVLPSPLKNPAAGKGLWSSRSCPMKRVKLTTDRHAVKSIFIWKYSPSANENCGFSFECKPFQPPPIECQTN